MNSSTNPMSNLVRGDEATFYGRTVKIVRRTDARGQFAGYVIKDGRREKIAYIGELSLTDANVEANADRAMRSNLIAEFYGTRR